MTSIQIPFTNAVIAQNKVTFMRETEAGELLIGIQPVIPAKVQPDDSPEMYAFEPTLTHPVIVQELGLPNRKIRYRVEAQYGRFVDVRGITHHLLLPVPGLSLRQQLSDAVFNKTMTLITEHNLQPAVAIEVIEQLYSVQMRAGIQHFFLHRVAKQSAPST